MASCKRSGALRRNVDTKRNSERATRVWGVTTLLCSGRNSGHDTPKRELRSDGLAGLMFTQVNVHGISRLDQLVKMFVVGSDNWILRQSASGVDHGKRVEAQELSVNQHFAA